LIGNIAHHRPAKNERITLLIRYAAQESLWLNRRSKIGPSRLVIRGCNILRH